MAGRWERTDNHFKSPATNDSELATDVEVIQKPVTEEMWTFRFNSDANLNKFAAEGSVLLQEEVIYYIYLCQSLIKYINNIININNIQYLLCEIVPHFYTVTCREIG
jgi:hypothetical protein